MCTVSHLAVVPLMGNSLRLLPARRAAPQLSEYFTLLVIKMHETCLCASAPHCTTQLSNFTMARLHLAWNKV